MGTHPVIDTKFWTLNLTSMAQDSSKIDTDGFNAIIITGDSIMLGPKEITDPLIEGITVN